MIQKRIVSVLLCAMSVLILVGSGFATHFLLSSEREKQVISAELQEGENETVKFQISDMVPGEEKSYTLKLYGETDGTHLLSFAFERTGIMTLEPFVSVAVDLEETRLYEGSLSDLLNRDSLSFECDLSKKEACEVYVTVRMSEEVGNEAQEAEADFQFLLQVSRTEESHE